MNAELPDLPTRPMFSFRFGLLCNAFASEALSVLPFITRPSGAVTAMSHGAFAGLRADMKGGPMAGV